MSNEPKVIVEVLVVTEDGPEDLFEFVTEIAGAKRLPGKDDPVDARCGSGCVAVAGSVMTDSPALAIPAPRAASRSRKAIAG